MLSEADCDKLLEEVESVCFSHFYSGLVPNVCLSHFYSGEHMDDPNACGLGRSSTMEISSSGISLKYYDQILVFRSEMGNTQSI